MANSFDDLKEDFSLKSANDDVLKKTLRLAMPAVLESVFVVLGNMIDTRMVASMGHVAVAAVGLTGQPKYFLMAPVFAINASVSALIARRRGEENRREAYSVAGFMILAATAYSLLAGILSAVFAEPVVRLCGGNAETAMDAAIYFRIIMGGLFFNSLTLVLNGIQRGCEKTHIVMVTNIASTVVNLFMNYCLIYGNLGFPRMGVAGAAIATVLGTVVSAVMAVCSLISTGNYISFITMFREKLGITKEGAAACVKLGSNTMSEDILKRFSFLYIGITAATTGTEPFAAYQVGMSLLNLAFAFGNGMQSAAIALVGNAMGRKDIPKAKKYVMRCQLVGIVMAACLSVLVLIFGRDFYSFFFDEAVLIALGVIMCRYIAAIIPFQVVQIIFSGTLKACGDVKYTLISSTACFGGLNLLLVILFVKFLNFGIYGVWAGTLTTQAVLAGLHTFRYMSGKWQDKEM